MNITVLIMEHIKHQSGNMKGCIDTYNYNLLEKILKDGTHEFLNEMKEIMNNKIKEHIERVKYEDNILTKAAININEYDNDVYVDPKLVSKIPEYKCLNNIKHYDCEKTIYSFKINFNKSGRSNESYTSMSASIYGLMTSFGKIYWFYHTSITTCTYVDKKDSGIFYTDTKTYIDKKLLALMIIMIGDQDTGKWTGSRDIVQRFDIKDKGDKIVKKICDLINQYHKNNENVENVPIEKITEYKKNEETIKQYEEWKQKYKVITMELAKTLKINKKYKYRIKNNIKKIKELESKLEIYKQIDDISDNDLDNESENETDNELDNKSDDELDNESEDESDDENP